MVIDVAGLLLDGLYFLGVRKHRSPRRRRGAAPEDIHVRCGMCGRETDYPPTKRDAFVHHSCDADLLVRERDPASEPEALDLFAFAVGEGPATDEAREAARDRLLYEVGEGPIPGLEDLLFRIKYTDEPFPPPELASRRAPDDAMPAIDVSDHLEMFLHRMKKYAITKRSHDEAPASVRPILAEKLERLKTEELESLED